MAIIVTEHDLDDMVAHYSEKREFAFDVETIGDTRRDAQIAAVAWISFACDDRSDVIPLGHPNGAMVEERFKVNVKGKQRMARGVPREKLNPKYDFLKERERIFEDPPEQLERGTVFDRLRPLFEGPALKIGHNIKFDLHAVAKYIGGYPAGPYCDTMVSAWLLDVSRKGLALAECVREFLGEDLEKGIGKDISFHSFEDVARYSLLDSEVTYRLKRALDRRYAKLPQRMRRLRDLEMAVIHPVLEMESTGVRIDSAVLSSIDEDLRRDIDLAQAEVYRAAGYRFNIRSNHDKQGLLFGPKSQGGRGLRGLHMTPGAAKKDPHALDIYDYSVDAETLLHYKDKDPVCAALLGLSALTKMHGTYVLPYLGGTPIRDTESAPKYVKSRLRNGRIHGEFKQHGTETGRFSSSNPNLQNIPSRTEAGKRLREVFVADPGHALVVADYSQIEPRIIASLSGDKTMITTYLDGGDVYQAVADRMGVTRPAGKELVLSIAYGVGAPTIAAKIGCSQAEARVLMNFFNAKFPAVGRHKSKVLAAARRQKYAETIFGRKRPLPALGWSNPELQSEAERKAYNHVIQGTAADIMKIALVNMYANLPPEARMLMTVHDEVVVQSPADLLDEVAASVKSCMESAKPASIVVPLLADVNSGRTWAEGKR